MVIAQECHSTQVCSSDLNLSLGSQNKVVVPALSEGASRPVREHDRLHVSGACHICVIEQAMHF